MLLPTPVLQTTHQFLSIKPISPLKELILVMKVNKQSINYDSLEKCRDCKLHSSIRSMSGAINCSGIREKMERAQRRDQAWVPDLPSQIPDSLETRLPQDTPFNVHPFILTSIRFQAA